MKKFGFLLGLLAVSASAQPLRLNFATTNLASALTNIIQALAPGGTGIATNGGTGSGNIFTNPTVIGIITSTNIAGNIGASVSNVVYTVSSRTGTVLNNGAHFGPDTAGTTTSGINEAIHALTNAANVLAGGKLQLGPGVFQCSGQVKIPNSNEFNLVIQGAGQSATAIVYTNTTVQDFFLCESNVDSGIASKNLSIVMRDLGIYYLKDTNKSIICNFANVHRALIDNCRFGAYNAFFLNTVASANNIDGYPTNALGIIGMKFANQSLNNTVVIQNSFFNALANGIELGSDHNRIRDCFFSNIGMYWTNGTSFSAVGRGTAWSNIATNKVAINTAGNDFVTQNNMRVPGAAIIGDNGIYELQIVDCEWYVVRCGFLSHGIALGPQTFVTGYNQFERTDYRVLGTLAASSGAGIQGLATLAPTAFVSMNPLSGANLGDAFVSLTNGAIASAVGANRVALDCSFQNMQQNSASFTYGGSLTEDYPPVVSFGGDTNQGNSTPLGIGTTLSIQVGFTGNPDDEGAICLRPDGSMKIANGTATITAAGRATFANGVVAGGTAALVNGKATITTAFAHVTNAITFSEYSPNGTNAVLNSSNIVANTSFQIISSVTGDTNIVSYTIFKP